MKISVSHIARLASLTLSHGEEKKFKKQLTSILDYVSQLDQVDTLDVLSVSQITGLENVTRDDETTGTTLTQEEVLANAPEKHNGLFKVKAILGGE